MLEVFLKLSGLQPAILLKKKLWHRSFPLVKFFRAPPLGNCLWNIYEQKLSHGTAYKSIFVITSVLRRLHIYMLIILLILFCDTWNRFFSRYKKSWKARKTKFPHFDTLTKHATHLVWDYFYVYFKKRRWWWWIVFVVWLTDKRRLALFPAGTIVRDPQNCESLTRRKQGLNLRRTWVQA